MVNSVAITRDDLDASGLRRAASRAREGSASRRMLALAMVLEGASRGLASKARGMDRQTLRDWVHRYNDRGLEGLLDQRGQVGAKRLLSPEQEAELAELVREGPDLATDGVVRWRRIDLVRVVKARFGVVMAVMAERSMSDVLRRLGFRRLVVRPRHPGHDASAQVSFRRSLQLL